MPLTRPEARYFSIPAGVCGGVVRRSSAWNCRPCSGSSFQVPSASKNSPATARGVRPTTTTGPRRPSTRARSTTKPFSALWNVTRSMVPVIRSGTPHLFFTTESQRPPRTEPPDPDLARGSVNGFGGAGQLAGLLGWILGGLCDSVVKKSSRLAEQHVRHAALWRLHLQQRALVRRFEQPLRLRGVGRRLGVDARDQHAALQAR